MTNDLISIVAAEQGLDRTNFWKSLCSTVIPAGASNEQVVAFLAVAHQYGLNPLTKEIYAFPAKGGIAPIVSVDGWLKLANRHPQFDGLETEEIRDGNVVTAVKCTVYRKDRAHPITATEYLSECRRNTPPWQQWPIRMLTNKSIVQAVRRAFSFAGIYDPDEGERISEADVVVVAANESSERGTKSKAADLKNRLSAESSAVEWVTTISGGLNNGADHDAADENQAGDGDAVGSPSTTGAPTPAAKSPKKGPHDAIAE